MEEPPKAPPIPSYRSIAEARARELRRRVDVEDAREEGREEGRQALVFAIITLLEVHFGVLPSELRERIESAEIIQLEQLVSRAKVATSLADLVL